MLQRLRCLQDAAATAAPSQLLPHLWISGAVPASSFHVLQHLGITHILNATQDLPGPPPSAGFGCALENRSGHCQAGGFRLLGSLLLVLPAWVGL